MTFFTICSNNYLGQASVLGNSIKLHYPNHHFLVALVDEKDDRIDYDAFPFEVIPVHEIEPELDVLVTKYNIIELNTCVKPRIIEFLFNDRNMDKVIYFDPDIMLYGQLTELETAIENENIVLTPHIYTPIPLDGKTPWENSFLNFGLYNLGFIGLRKTDETERFVSWWKERTYKEGYARTEDGIFVDQLYINLVPLLFDGVHILKHMGYNMAPWNLHERYLSVKDGFVVNGKDQLKFFHFSSFKFNSNELPTHFYNRFRLKDRSDLQLLYDDYNTALQKAGYATFSTIKCSYVIKREQYVRNVERIDWQKKSLIKRMFLSIIRKIPLNTKRRIANSLIHN